MFGALGQSKQEMTWDSSSPVCNRFRGVLGLRAQESPGGEKLCFIIVKQLSRDYL